MITNVTKIVDGKFVITAEVKDLTKNYLIGEDIFISEVDRREYALGSESVKDLRHDGVLVAAVVSELQELENTYVVTDIIDMYVRGYSVEKTRESIINRVGKLNID